MDMEEIENQLEERQQIRDTLGMDLSVYETFRFNATNGMLQYGDSFSQALGTALALAERKDAIKIIRYWYSECEKYAHMFKLFLAKKETENE